MSGRHDPEVARITGAWVKRERKAQGWTQGELQWRAHLGANDVSKYEHAKTVPTLAKVRRMAEAFHGGPFESVPEFNDYARELLDAVGETSVTDTLSAWTWEREDVDHLGYL